MIRLVAALLLMLAQHVSSFGASDSFKMDDSASQVLSANPQMQWRSVAPGKYAGHEVETKIRVNVHIDTRPWIGKTGRIYMVLPHDADTRITADWQTQGRLLPGQLTSGGRALVYSGLLMQDSLKDQILVQLRADGRWMTNTRRLNFYFELDLD